MKIAVCVKYVPDATSDRSFVGDANTTDRENVDGLLCELDEYAVEEALKIVEAGEGEVTVICMGPAQASEAVKKSLQMGADKAVHISDAALSGSDAVGTATVLAAAINKIGPVDLVITGMASTDGTGSVVASMLAELLQLPQITFASELTIEGDSVTMRRDGDLATEIVQAKLPAVVSVTDQINEPRYPSFKGIMAAKKKPVESWTLADLGVDPATVGLAGAWTQVAEANKRPARQQGLIVSDDGAGGDVLAQFLALQKFV